MSAVRGDQQLLGMRGPERGLPVDDGVADLEAVAHLRKQVKALTQRGVGNGEPVGRPVALRWGGRATAQGSPVIEQGVSPCGVRHGLRLPEGTTQPARAGVAGGGVAHRTTVGHADHQALVAGPDRRLGQVLPHAELLAGLRHMPNRPEVNSRGGAAHPGFKARTCHLCHLYGNITADLRRCGVARRADIDRNYLKLARKWARSTRSLSLSPRKDADMMVSRPGPAWSRNCFIEYSRNSSCWPARRGICSRPA